MSNLDINVTFFHQDNPAFCLEEKGENLNDKKSTYIVKDAKEDKYEDNSNESLAEDLTLWMPFYIRASCLKEKGLENLIK